MPASATAYDRRARGAPGPTPQAAASDDGARRPQKSHGLLRERVNDPVAIHRFIDAEKANCPIKVLWEAVSVARSSVYERQCREPSKRAVCNSGLTLLIEEVHQQSRGTYGAPRVRRALRKKGCAAAATVWRVS